MTHIDGKALDPLVQGTAMLDDLTMDEALDLLDGVVAEGARAFDLAHHYGAGVAEERFGVWLARRGRRDDLLLIGKGGHPDAVTGRHRIRANEVAADLEASSARLGIDAFDLYLLHRDDESVPVERIVDFLHDLRLQGRVRAYGVSNWRHERIEAANAYARRHGLEPLAASSSHFSLAVPLAPPWPGTVSVAGDAAAAARAFYRTSGPPLLAWSSLAMGFFGLADAPGRGREQALADSVFGDAANVGRRERARALAHDKGLTPTQVALAYVTSQPMTVHPIVGCRSAAEYRELRAAAEVRLTPDESSWLEGSGRPAGN